jgi:hypothetical protein
MPHTAYEFSINDLTEKKIKYKSERSVGRFALILDFFIYCKTKEIFFKYKITNNKLGYVRDYKDKMEEALRGVKQQMEIVTEDGRIEKWTWEVDIEKVKEDLKKGVSATEIRVVEEEGYGEVQLLTKLQIDSILSRAVVLKK